MRSRRVVSASSLDPNLRWKTRQNDFLRLGVDIKLFVREIAVSKSSIVSYVLLQVIGWAMLRHY
jgi:hypothetical protein